MSLGSEKAAGGTPADGKLAAVMPVSVVSVNTAAAATAHVSAWLSFQDGAPPPPARGWRNAFRRCCAHRRPGSAGYAPLERAFNDEINREMRPLRLFFTAVAFGCCFVLAFLWVSAASIAAAGGGA